jgi:hypothetical protein
MGRNDAYHLCRIHMASSGHVHRSNRYPHEAGAMRGLDLAGKGGAEHSEVCVYASCLAERDDELSASGFCRSAALVCDKMQQTDGKIQVSGMAGTHGANTPSVRRCKRDPREREGCLGWTAGVVCSLSR